MTTLTPQQVADLKAKIANKYAVMEDDGGWFVGYEKTWNPASEANHFSYVDAEAEMDAIIQDELKAAMEEME
jgi:hypothetical protein